jgi:tyrosyl-tRNA synthetase
VEGNPVIEIANHFIFNEKDKLIIQRPDKFGGNLELNQSELLEMYVKGEVHPQDLKNAVAESLIEILTPVRDYLKY